MNRWYQCLLIAAVSACLCSGCGSHELENRSFPLAVGIEKEEEDCKVVFNFPMLSEVADENADGSDTTIAAGTGTNFFTIEKGYEKSSSKKIDFSHNKVLILSESFLEDEKKLDGFLAYARTQDLMARNTCLFVTKIPMEELFLMDENLEKPLGTYLEELLESDQDYKNQQLMTLGNLYDERVNRMETLYFPVLGEKNQKPVIEASYILKNGEPLGEAAVETALDSLMLQGRLRTLAYQDREGREWQFTRMKPSYEFKRAEEGPVVNVVVKCRASLENGQVQDWRQQEKLERQLGAELGNRLNQEADTGLMNGYDITNSYKRFGRYDKKSYLIYKKTGDYEENLRIKVAVCPSIVDTN